MSNIYTIPLKTLDGTETTLAPYQGDMLLIVNVASRCGFTSQYKALEALHQDYQARGLHVLGFPCNQFLHQEPGDADTIQHFTSSCFHITFPLFEKTQAKGQNQSPLYAYLEQHIEKKPWLFVPWNFTKILVGRDGRVLQHFLPTTRLTYIKHTIDKQL
jgi:glutathione peroxidase